ncbi:MAG: hypothetical protein NC548_34535 [Lachnospiraceae bacterium]|nr:hypothetical protein [Lachnospiraceae bacterium]
MSSAKLTAPSADNPATSGNDFLGGLPRFFFVFFILKISCIFILGVSRFIGAWGNFPPTSIVNLSPFVAQFTVLAIFLHISADFIYFRCFNSVSELCDIILISILMGDCAVIVLGVRQFYEIISITLRNEN